MPRAEVGSTKHIANQIKAKGLTRLRWYCQVCEKANRDANGFKCHVQSESHVRKMLALGENPQQAISDYSKDFQHDFIKLLRTAHGEKMINVNHFYQEYIADRNHIHMNATRWPSLTEFTKFLGREGICRVEDSDKGLLIGWIDNSPDALRRQEAIRKKERQDKGDEEREQRQIEQQIERARAAARADANVDDEARSLQRKDGEKIKLNFGSATAAAAAPAAKLPTPPKSSSESEPSTPEQQQESKDAPAVPSTKDTSIPAAPAKVALSFGASKPKNVLTGKNALAGKKSVFKEAPKKMSEQERIMKKEMAAMERKRGGHGFAGGVPSFKKQKSSQRD